MRRIQSFPTIVTLRRTLSDLWHGLFPFWASNPFQVTLGAMRRLSLGAVVIWSSGIDYCYGASFEVLEWRMVDSPIQVEEALKVGKLTVEPGVEVLFDSGVELEVNILLSAVGTPENPIRLRRLNDDEPWGGLTIRGTDEAQLAHVTIEGSNRGGLKVFDCSPELRHCVIRSNVIEGSGGGLQTNASLDVVEDCVFASNDADGFDCKGGGIYSTGERLVLRRCEVSGNRVHEAAGRFNRIIGGGVYFEGQRLEIYDSLFRSNYGLVGHDVSVQAVGGGLYARCSEVLEIERSDFVSNWLQSQGSGHATNCQGAGLYLVGGRLSLEDCEIRGNELKNDNHSQSQGAGIHHEAGTLLLVRCTVVGNEIIAPGQHPGAGIQSSGELIVKNCVIARNTKRTLGVPFKDEPFKGWGAGISSGASQSGTIINSVIADNSYQGLNSFKGTLVNTIVYGNGGEQIAGTSPTVSFSCIEGGYDGEGNIASDPLFRDQSIYTLKMDSPCVNMGRPGEEYNDHCFPPSLDPSQAGRSRNDIGAYGGPDACGWLQFGDERPRIWVNDELISSGRFADSERVEIRIENGFRDGSVLYTLDGSDPLSGEVYDAPFLLNASATIRVIGLNRDTTESAEAKPLPIEISLEYELIISSPGGGRVEVTGGELEDSYLEGAEVSVRAIVEPGWTFLRWEGDAAGDSPEVTLVMNQNRHVRAIFGTSISLSTIGGGRILAVPEVETVPFGVTSRIFPVADPGHYFRRWGGDALDLGENPLSWKTVRPGQSISALFAPLPEGMVTVTVTASEGGFASRIYLEGTDPELFRVGDEVGLNAHPDPGYRFVRWSGIELEDPFDPSVVFTVGSSNVRVFAEFAPKRIPIEATVYYSLDGDLRDQGEGERHGQARVGSPTYVSGPVGQGLKLDPTWDSRIEIDPPWIPAGRSFTVAGWIRVDEPDEFWDPSAPGTAPSPRASVVTYQDRGFDQGFTLGMRYSPEEDLFSPSFSVVGQANTGNSVSRTINSSFGEWIHLLGVADREGGEIYLYVNGLMVASSVLTTSELLPTKAYLGSLDFDFQRNEHSQWESSGVRLDEVFIVDRVLTESEIAQLVVPVESSVEIGITSPENARHFKAPASIEIGATLRNISLPARKVEFFAAGEKIGEALNEPFRTEWSTAPLGVHLLTAQATMADGSLIESQCIEIEVREPGTEMGLVIADEHRLVASNAQGANDQGYLGDELGQFVDIDGDTVVASSRHNSDGKSVAAYVFVRDGAVWREEAQIQQNGRGKLALSEGTIVIGSRGEDDSRGAVYVYRRNNLGEWVLEQRLTAADGEQGDEFGTSVAIEGKTIAVGAPGVNDIGSGGAGAAYVFVRDAQNHWTQQGGQLIPSDAGVHGGPDDSFGAFVALSGDTLLVGSPLEDLGSNPKINNNHGAAYVFVRSGATWTEEAKLLASDGNGNDQLGHWCDLSGDTAVVGAHQFVSGKPGAAYVYERTELGWRETIKLTAPDGVAGDVFGGSVSIDGDSILVTARNHNNAQGAAYLFLRRNGDWVLGRKIETCDGEAGDDLGLSGVIQGSNVVMGAENSDNFRGKVYVKRISNISQPTLSFVETLNGGIENCEFQINYETLAGAANENDFDRDPVSFRLESIISGQLTKDGRPVVQGVTVIGPGDRLGWLPEVGANGVLDAFSIVAWDGSRASSSPVPVRVNVVSPSLLVEWKLDQHPGSNVSLSPTILPEVRGRITAGDLYLSPILGSGYPLAGNGDFLTQDFQRDLQLDRYIEFRLGTEPENGVKLSRLSYTLINHIASSRPGPKHFELRASLTGFRDDSGKILAGHDLSQPYDVPKAFVITDFSNLGPEIIRGEVTFRLYGNNADAPRFAGLISRGAVQNPRIEGAVASKTLPPIPMPPPNPPVLSSVEPLEVSSAGLPIVINYSTLAEAADESDPDGDVVSFRLNSMISGELREGGIVLDPGQSLLEPGESWFWTPERNAIGRVGAFTIVAWDGTDPSSPPVLVQIDLKEDPGVRFAENFVVVSENGGVLSIDVIKGDGPPASVAYELSSDGANEGRDFVLPPDDRRLDFAGGTERKPIEIRLLDDLFPEDPERFTLTLSEPSGAIIGLPNEITVEIRDDEPKLEPTTYAQLVHPQFLWTNGIDVRIVPTNAPGKVAWRFPWERIWHMSHDRYRHLRAGDYPIVFRPLQGFSSPSLLADLSLETSRLSVTGRYVETKTQTGQLEISLGPAVLTNGDRTGWRFVSDDEYFAADAGPREVVGGVHIVEFEPVDGWVAPPSAEVLVIPGALNQFTGLYRRRPAVGNGIRFPEPVPVFHEITRALDATLAKPLPFVGQIRTEFGWASGFAVGEQVVITVAHALYEPGSDKISRFVEWFPARHAGEHESAPIRAQGWYIFDEYDELRQDLIEKGFDPGISTPELREWDVAAIYFEDLVGWGGRSGYLWSDEPQNPWIFGIREKFLAGYPLGLGHDGRLFESEDRDYTFFSEQGNVFASSDFLSFPGNSGGPLCVLLKDANTFFPAAVYLGSTAANTHSLFRAFDRQVVDLINRAASSARLGVEFVSPGVLSGPLRPEDPNIVHPFVSSVVSIRVEPERALRHGGGWRFRGSDNGFITDQEWTGALVPEKEYTIEFAPAAGYLEPKDSTFTAIGGFNDWNANFCYLPTTTLSISLEHGIVATGNPGAVMVVEYTSSLGGTWNAKGEFVLVDKSLIVVPREELEPRYYRARQLLDE